MSVSHNTATVEMHWERALRAAIGAVEELIKLVGFKDDDIDVDESEIACHISDFESAMSEMEDVQQRIDEASADMPDVWWDSLQGENVSEIIDFDFSERPDYEDMDELISMEDNLSDVGGFTFPTDLEIED